MEESFSLSASHSLCHSAYVVDLPAMISCQCVFAASDTCGTQSQVMNSKWYSAFLFSTGPGYTAEISNPVPVDTVQWDCLLPSIQLSEIL